ncbi:hypothetical protein Nepgr_014688 [Nepenthes gracilis]|uniref:Uncharacterized protein n=1 Tax=Nepenthes gracilis TaxID=150966 RepID=A0AAD3SKH3_NEPGR|nr:hypothetical protein Nepgr_014688 [Nepenthes gracilis]
MSRAVQPPRAKPAAYQDSYCIPARSAMISRRRAHPKVQQPASATIIYPNFKDLPQQQPQCQGTSSSRQCKRIQRRHPTCVHMPSSNSREGPSKSRNLRPRANGHHRISIIANGCI